MKQPATEFVNLREEKKSSKGSKNSGKPNVDQDFLSPQES